MKGVGLGYRIRPTEFKILCYADNAVFIAESEDFNQTANRYNMNISKPKTKSRTISKKPIRCKLALNDQPIEQVVSFEYLGIIASSSRNTYNELKTLVNKECQDVYITLYGKTNKKSNEIREPCDRMPDVVRWSRGRRRKWRKHVDRMGNDRLAKAAYKEKPNTTRPLGRPPKRWADSWTSSSQDIK